MNVNGIGAIGSSRTEGGTDIQILGKEDFLTLLITQLQHQDPLNPTDSVEFTAQLAQFSSLEQLGNVNDNLEKLELYQASINNSQAVAFIGKEIVAGGNTLTVAGGQPVACQFELSADAAAVSVSVYDDSGGFVRSLDGRSMAAGRQSVLWDARDQNGNPVADGAYRFEIMAEDGEGEQLQTRSFANGVVSGVSFADNVTYLICDGRKIPVSDVVQVNQQPAAAQNP